MAASRAYFDRFAVVGASDLVLEEVDRYRPDLYRALARSLTEPAAIKVHDAFRVNADGEPLFPADVTRAVIYVVRDPRDVAVSLAHHRGCSVHEAVDEICRSGAVIAGAGGGRRAQVPQWVGSWSEHVRSWLDAESLPTHCVRYEDLLAAPEAAFAGLVRAMGLPLDEERLERAIRFSRFEELQRQERRSGFRERLAESPFFRSGRSGGWRSALSPEDEEEIRRCHWTVMMRCGYDAA